ncbi:MAG: tail fiber domain-containing protein, partial [Proteobacteria bacterium]
LLQTNGSGALSWITPSAAAPVSSVNGSTGVVVLTSDNIAEGSTNKYFSATVAKNAAVADTIVDATTDVAPSQNAVFDALALKLNKAGGTMSGPIAMGTNKITGLGTPTATDDAATKAYADSAAAAAALASEPAFVAGTSFQFWRGDKTWQTLDSSIVPENTNLYFTQTRARSSINATSPVAYNSTTGAISMGAATSVSSGYLSASDWISFNAKQAPFSSSSVIDTGTLTTALQNGVQLKPFGTATGESGELRFSELVANGSNYIGFKAPDALAANRIWTLPAADGASGQLLQTNGSGALSWITPSAAAPVSSVNGSTGVVVLTSDNIAEGSTNKYFSATAAKNAAVADTIVDATTDVAPSQNAVFDALALKLNKAGGTMTGPIAMGTSKITGLGTPTATDDAATKAYADTKESAITAGTTSQFFRGDKSWQTLDTSIVPENTNLYYTQTRARGSVSATAPVAYNSTTGVISMGAATSVSNGYLSSGDWISFNAKQAPITSASVIDTGTLTTALQNGVQLKPFGTATGESGELRFSELVANGSNYIGFKAPDALAANRIWTLPAADGTSGQLLQTNGSGALSWITPSAAAPVSSVNGSTGAVVLTTDNIAEGSTNKYFSAAAAKNAAVADTIVDATTDVAPSQNAVFDALALKLNKAGGTMTGPIAMGTSKITGLGTPSATDDAATKAYADTKESAITAGTTAQFFRGDKTWQILDTSIVPENTNLYYTQTRARGSVSATTPVAYNSTTGVISMGAATSVSNGYLSSGDWISFNAKQAPITSSSVIDTGTLTTALQNGVQLKPFGTATGESGELRFSELIANGSHYVGFKSPDLIASNKIWTLPATDGSSGQVLSTNGSTILGWTSIGALASQSSVTSAEITDGTIVNADINASAAIADTKLATISTAGKVSGAAITSGTIAGTTVFNTSGAITTTSSITGTGNFLVNATGGAATELRFGDNDNSNYIGFKSPASVATNLVWTLPSADGTSGYVLSTNGTGTMSWVANTAGAVTSVAAGTGLSGGPITSTGTLSLANTAVTPAAYTRANITVDQQGRLTAASNGGNVNLSSEVTGTLPVGNGGTGLTAGTSGGIPYYSSTSTLASSAALTANGVLLGGGAGAAPASTAAGAAYQTLRIPSGGGAPVFGALDISQSAAVTGVLSVANGGTNSSTTLSNNRIMVSNSGGIKEAAALTNGQLLIGATVGAPVAGTLSQGSNAGVTVTNGGGTITLDTVQDIRTTASPTFAGVTLGSGSLKAASFVAGTGDAGATPTGGSLRSASAAGTNLAGTDLTITSGNGTGTGGSGSINFQTAPVSTTGSTANSMASRLFIDKNGSIGIDSITPGAKFEIGNAGSKTTGLRIKGGDYNTGTANFWMEGGGFGQNLKVQSYSGTGSAIENGPSNILLNPLGGYVGIGAPSPDTKLTVQGIGTTTGPNLLHVTSNDTLQTGMVLSNSSTGGHGYQWYTTGSAHGSGAGDLGLFDATAGGVRMLFDASGKVGLGTEAPEAKFHIKDNNSDITFGESQGKLTTGGFPTGIYMGPYSNPTAAIESAWESGPTPVFRMGIVRDSVGANISMDYGGKTQFRRGTSAYMTIAADGKVGIGTATPPTPLQVIASSSSDPDVNGIRVYNATASAGNNAVLAASVNGASSGNPLISFDISGVTGWTAGIDNADSDKFKISNAWNSLTFATKMTIQTDGAVGIGTTTPSDKLHVAGDVRVGTGTTGCLKDADATVIAGSCSSDIRFKKDIKPLGRILDRISLLRPSSYYWRSDEFPDRHFGLSKQIGLIAQDVLKVIPELVAMDDTGYYRVNYSGIPMYLLGAVIDLKGDFDRSFHDHEASLLKLRLENDNLIERQAALEKEVDDLRSRSRAQERKVQRLLNSMCKLDPSACEQ